MNDIYTALITRLTGWQISYIDPLSDIAYDNAVFDPANKEAWLATSFIPVDRATDTKDTTGVIDTGLFQVDVFVPMNDQTGGAKQYNLRALEIMSDVLDAFAQNTQLAFGNAKVSISSSEFAEPQPSESWYQIPITINFKRI